MSEELKQKVMELPLDEFFSKLFFDEALHARNITRESGDVWRILVDRQVKAINGVVNGLREEVRRRQIDAEMKNEPFEEPTLRVKDLIKKMPAELLRFPNFGRKSLEWLRDYLALFDLRLEGTLGESALIALGKKLSPQATEVLELLRQNNK